MAAQLPPTPAHPGGQPRAGVRVSLGEKGEPLETDADGLVTVLPRAGLNQLLAIEMAPAGL